MNYNVKVNIERFNGKYNSTVELSGPGRSGVKRSSTSNFDECLAATKAHHDELLAHVEAYHNPPELVAQRAAEEAAKAEAEKNAAAEAKKAAAKAAKKPAAAKKAEGEAKGDGVDTGKLPKVTKSQKAPKRKFAVE